MAPTSYLLPVVLVLCAMAVSGVLLLLFARWRPISIRDPVSDGSILRTAQRVIRRHKRNAARFAEAQAAKQLAEGNAAGAETWRRIQQMIEGLEAAKG